MALVIKGNKQYALILDEEEMAFVAAMADFRWERKDVASQPDESIYEALCAVSYYRDYGLPKVNKYHPTLNSNDKIAWTGE